VGGGSGSEDARDNEDGSAVHLGIADESSYFAYRCELVQAAHSSAMEGVLGKEKLRVARFRDWALQVWGREFEGGSWDWTVRVVCLDSGG